MASMLEIPEKKWLMAVRLLSRGGPDSAARALLLLLDAAACSDAGRVSDAVERAVRARKRGSAEFTATPAGRAARVEKTSPAALRAAPGARQRTQPGRDRGATRSCAAERGVNRRPTSATRRATAAARSPAAPTDEWYAPHTW